MADKKCEQKWDKKHFTGEDAQNKRFRKDSFLSVGKDNSNLKIQSDREKFIV